MVSFAQFQAVIQLLFANYVQINDTQVDRYFTVNCISSSSYKIK